MSIFKSIGKAVKGIGKLAGGAIKGTVGKLPIVGGSFNNIGRALSGEGAFLPQMFKGLAPLAAGAGSFGLGPLAGIMGKIGLGSKLSDVGAKSSFGKNALGFIGKTLKSNFTNPEGGLDLGRTAGAGAGIMSLIGQSQQRNSMQKRLGAEDNVRNQLLSQLLTRPQYNFAPTGQ
jgi:hypothetical protein